MDKKDEIILQQLEVIRSMTEHSMKNMGNDLFGKRVSLDEESPFYVPPKKRTELGKGAPDEKGNVTAGSGGLNKGGNTDKNPKDAVKDADKKNASGKPDEAGEKCEEELPPPEKIEDLKAELNGYIGLESIKKEVSNLINMVTVHNMRKEAGLPVTDLSLHMVFSGNPGTGKSTVARIMARIYRSLGILSKGQLIEVDRAGLVAGYVGQTAIKTQEVIEKAKGGLLFIDEAYALSNKSENDFGQEAIDTILKAMEDNRDDLVIIVAGYDKLMDDFVHSNPGLESRFNRYLHFEDYTLDEMTAIFRMYCKKSFYELGEGTEEAVRDFIEAENTNSISFGNARGVRNVFEHILVCQANRLAAQAELLNWRPENGIPTGESRNENGFGEAGKSTEEAPEGMTAKAVGSGDRRTELCRTDAEKEAGEKKPGETAEDAGKKKTFALTKEDLMRITVQDVEAARKDAEEGWSPAARKDSDRGGSGEKSVSRGNASEKKTTGPETGEDTDGKTEEEPVKKSKFESFFGI